jgi:hypothetical protein
MVKALQARRVFAMESKQIPYLLAYKVTRLSSSSVFRKYLCRESLP